MMRTLITLCCVLMVGLTLTPDTAEAKRFGGGSSFGKFFSTPKKTQPISQPAQRSTTQTAQTQKTATAPAKKPGMGGMLGGLLAGGLLAALFMGGAFDGIQLMDILILGLIAFLAYKLFARAKPPQPQYAGHGHTGEGEPARTARPQAFTPTPLMSNGLASEQLTLPTWFNRDAFLEGAKQHFAQLQLAWNRNDLEEIRSYCAPELFEVLVAERQGLGEAHLDNDLVSVMAELLGFQEVNGEAQLSINFYGWMREGTDAQTTEFNEIWHLTRDLAQPSADWFIVGIEQPG